MTPQQANLYGYLLARIDDPVAPTFSEMTDAMGFKSKSQIHRLLEALERQGKIKRASSRARSVRAVRPSTFDGVQSSAMVEELRRRGESGEITPRAVAEVILDAMYGPRMGAFYLRGGGCMPNPKVGGVGPPLDVRGTEGLRAAERVIEFFAARGGLNAR